jgi:hypothetical protein
MKENKSAMTKRPDRKQKRYEKYTLRKIAQVSKIYKAT